MLLMTENSSLIPFVYGRVVSDPYFVNRTNELERLTNNFQSGINTFIISSRRWGKSSLVERSAQQILEKNKNIRVCKLDLFNIRNEKEFYETYVRQVLKSTSNHWEDWLENGKKFLKGIVPRFSFGMDPEQEFSVSFDITEKSKNISEILSLPETIAKARKLKIVICIDEFQNLEYYNDSLAFQKRLRAAWQHHSHTSYCLYGSKQHIISNIFENKSMPFYKFGDVMFLQKIATDEWINFITSTFKRTGKNISKEIAQLIPCIVMDHPYFVQQLAQKTWIHTQRKANRQIVEQSLTELLHENAILYIREVENLSNTQINFLHAVCDRVKQLSASETIRKYNLGTSANVIRIKNALEQKEVLDLMGAYPEFIDPLFELWMKKVYFKN